jgi:hypothetical protein
MNWKDLIPKIYHSEYTGEPFATCLVCEQALSEAGDYMVEKVIRNGEAVLEMALCGACAEGMIREYSQESLEREIRTLETWMSDGGPDGEECIGCRKPRDHAGGFVLAAEILESQRSRQTRENFGGFIEKHFPGVPHYVDLPVVLT